MRIRIGHAVGSALVSLSIALGSLAVASADVIRTAAAQPVVSPATGTPWALGTMTALTNKPTCPAGYACTQFNISGCTNVQEDRQVVLAKSSPSGQTPQGLVVFFSGAGGTSWWGAGTGLAGTMVTKLRDVDKFVVVQVKFISEWLKSLPGEDSGAAHLACRPATIVNWVYLNWYLPLGITAALGSCGFCITGNSGGSAEVSYALSFYGLDYELNAIIPTSGPTHAAMLKGCLTGYGRYTYPATSIASMDKSSGHSDETTNPGPCCLHDSAYSDRWIAGSVDTGGSDYQYPTTRVQIVIGQNDLGPSPDHAGDYRDVLQLDPHNHVIWTVVPGMAHTIQQSQSGLDALEAALLASL